MNHFIEQDFFGILAFIQQSFVIPLVINLLTTGIVIYGLYYRKMPITIPIKEMTYLFVIIGISIINALAKYRNRFLLQATGSYEYARFTASWRTRLQLTLLETDEPRGDIFDDDSFKWVWRNRLGLKYNIKGLPLKPYQNFEWFHHLFSGQDDTPGYYQNRFSAGIEYKFAKQHMLEAGYSYSVIQLLFFSLFILFVWSGCLKDPELQQKPEEADPYTAVQPGNDIASGIDLLDGIMPLRYAFSADGRRLITGAGQRSDFYDIDHIRRVDLTFPQSNWWSQLTSNYSSGKDIPARMTYDGTELAYNIGVHFKGFTSYSQNRTEKKSFRLSLDYENDQKVGEYKNLKFHCAYSDNAFMREVIYGAVNQRYIPQVSSNYIDLYINGAYWGIYINMQHIDNNFLREWFLSKNGSRWRANGGGGGGMPGGGGRPGGGMPGGGGMGAGTSSLNYLGDKGSSYESYYSLKKTTRNDPWQDLANVCKALNQTSSSELEAKVSEVLDLDRTLWYLACEIIFTDDDSYVEKGGMDYYIFWETATGRLTPLEWDGNEVLHSSNTSWSPFYHETSTNYPLLNKLLAVPNIRQRYLAHFRTILEESFNPDAMNDLIDRNAARIDAYINADPKKMMTYAQFTNEVTNLKTIIRTRYNYLTSNAEVNVKGLTISDVQWSVNGESWAQPSQDEQILVTAKISGDNGVSSVYLYGSTGLAGNFSPIEMFDDGNHDDGQANDGLYGCYIPAQNEGVRVRFYIEATAANSVKTKTYEPAGAEHDVYTFVVL